MFSDEEKEWLYSGLPINTTVMSRAVPNVKLRELLDFKKRIDQGKQLLERMRSASECDFAEMPYWSDQVIKILNGECSIEDPQQP